MVTRILKFILLGLTVAFSQTIVSNLTSIHGIAPNFCTIYIFLIVLKCDYEVAYPAVFMVGLIADALNPEMMGLGTAVRFAVGVAVYEIKHQLDIEQIPTRLYLLIGTEFCFQLIYQMFVHAFDFSVIPQIYLETSLPTLGYTAVVGLLILFATDFQYRLEIGRRSVV